MAGEFPDESRDWQDAHWKALLDQLVDLRVLTWKEIAVVALGELNPPQVGTAIASRKSFQRHYPPRRTWRAVRAWFYSQSGRCEDCKTRIMLEGEHLVPRAEIGDEADVLTNMQLLCKRCNAIKRPSHKNAGLTDLTAQSALMWLLFVHKPTTYLEYGALCRAYGLTMANIRFQEAWALAIWLSREGLYELDEADPWLAQALAEPWDPSGPY